MGMIDEFPVGGSSLFFLPDKQISSNQFCPGGGPTGLFTPFCGESSSFVEGPYRDANATAADKERGYVGRDCTPPYQRDHGDCAVVTGPGGIYSHYFLATKCTGFCPILNLSRITTYLRVSKFHMETIACFKVFPLTPMFKFQSARKFLLFGTSPKHL